MTTTEHFTAVFKHETNGTVSGWIGGLPGVYASADTIDDAKVALREALEAHLGALRRLNQSAESRSEVHVLRYTGEQLEYVGLGALLGKKTSEAKASASRANGRKGGRPRRDASKAR